MYNPPPPPLFVTVELAAGAVVVQWFEARGRQDREGITHYDVYRQQAAGPWQRVASVYPSGTPVRDGDRDLDWYAWTDGEAIRGTAYKYGVTVVGYYYGNVSPLPITFPVTSP